MSIHELAPDSFSASVAARLALAGRCLRVHMPGMSEDTRRARRGVGWHELAVLGQPDQSLVSVVVPAECRDDTSVQVVQEPLCTATLVCITIPVGCRSASSLNR